MPSPDLQLRPAKTGRRTTPNTLAHRQLAGQSGQHGVDDDGPDPTSGPRDGDVVVTYENRSPARFAVRQIPGVVQLTASTRERALRIARGFAQKHGLDVWFSEDGTYRLLEAYRIRMLNVRSRVSDACS